MSVHHRRNYDSVFKRNAVLLSEEPGRTVSEVGDNIGIASDLLCGWRREYRAKEGLAFLGHGREGMTSQEKKIRELERKLKDVETERDILKKAMAIFSRAPK